jgi:hypothetical protein
VIPLGVAGAGRRSRRRRAAARARPQGDVVACVGTVQPRKHVERVIDAFGQAGGEARGWTLAIAGRLRPGYAPAWTASPPAGVRWLGPLDDAELVALYRTAAIVVSASEYEGFGLTLCEGMAASAAVVAVATSSVPEVVGDAGILVARSDAALLAGALRRCSTIGGPRGSGPPRRGAAGFTGNRRATRDVRRGARVATGRLAVVIVHWRDPGRRSRASTACAEPRITSSSWTTARASRSATPARRAPQVTSSGCPRTAASPAVPTSAWSARSRRAPTSCCC